MVPLLFSCEAGCRSAEVAESVLDQVCEARIEQMRERLDSFEPHADLIEDRPWLVELETGGSPVIEVGTLLSVVDGNVLLDGERVGAIGQPQPEVLANLLDTQVRNWRILNPGKTRERFPVYLLADGDQALEDLLAWMAGASEALEPRLVFRRPPDGPTLSDASDAVPADAPAHVGGELSEIEARPWEAEERSAALWSDAAGGCPALGRLFAGIETQTRAERKITMRDAAPGVARQCGCGLVDVPMLEALVVYAIAPRGPEMVWVPLSTSSGEAGTTVQMLADSLGSD